MQLSARCEGGNPVLDGPADGRGGWGTRVDKKFTRPHSIQLKGSRAVTGWQGSDHQQQ